MSTNDPGAFLRAMLGEWQRASGGDAQAGGAQALRQVTERALAAANMPSRADLEELSARIGRVEAALFRIEALLHEQRPSEPPAV